MVWRIKDDLIDTLVFRNKYEIAISDILILPVCFLKVKPKVNKKIKRNKARFHCLFAFRWIPNAKTWNTQFKFWNTQLSQKEVGKYPIASNPYLELWETNSVDPGQLLASGTGRSVSPLLVNAVPLHFSKGNPACRYKSQQRPSAPDDPCRDRHPQVRL